MATKTADVLTFADLSAAMTHAQHHARYGHRSWMVWRNAASGACHAGRVTATAVERAIDESGCERHRCFYIEATTGTGIYYGLGGFRVMLSNLKAGY